MLGRLRSLVRRRACVIERIGRASLAYHPEHTIYLREYYLYCVDLWRTALARVDAPLNVVFGDYPVDFGNDRRSVRVDLQYEHTLVKPGGRDSEGSVPGRIPIGDGGGGGYLVRLARRPYLESLDTVVEYSLPNLVNVRTSQAFPAYLRKAVYIAPLLYDAELAPRPRDIDVVTLIHDVAQPRRKRFFEQARAARLPLRNVRGKFDKHALRALYDRTRILVNLRQTDHHDTLEELRILPALLRGVIVVSEDVPLRDEVPYHRAVVWARYADLVETARDVLARYEQYRARLFDDPSLGAVLQRLREDNLAHAEGAVRALLDDSFPGA